MRFVKIKLHVNNITENNKIIDLMVVYNGKITVNHSYCS